MTMRSAVLATILVFVAGCSQERTLCNANEGGWCGDCGGPTVTCSYDDVTVTEPSCEGCQAQRELFDALCAAGSDATVEEVEAGRVCEDVDDTDV